MIKPLHDYVLIKKQVTENKTASGIYLSSNEKIEDNIGVVIAIGEGKVENGVTLPLTVKVNDKVIFDKYATTEIEYQKEKYLLISEGKILAVIE